MKESLYIIFIAVIVALLALILVGCNSDLDLDGQTKVVFQLEGGIFKNCEDTVTYYYPLEDGTEHSISDPATLNGNKYQVEREGYVLKGWYKTKTIDGENVTYSDPWDFSSDKIRAGENVTLYAMWRKAVNYTYKLCYMDGDTEVELGVYETNEGSVFSDYSNYRNERIGYTFLSFVDADGNPWNEDFKHPGGDNDCEVKVYAKYIQGDYVLVSSAKDLRTNASKGKNIYLLSDIDLGGQSLTFGNYGGIFEGNGHTVKNFTISYKDGKDDLVSDYEDDSKKSLEISLFGRTMGAKISNVKFEDAIIDIDTTNSLIYKIYVAPISVVSDAELVNVSFSGSYKVTKLPRGFDQEERLVIVENAPWVSVGDSTFDKDSTFLLVAKAE